MNGAPQGALFLFLALDLSIASANVICALMDDPAHTALH
jgi:hypothetical protein